MSDEKCRHGMLTSWCATCNGTESAAPRDRRGESGFHGGTTKQDVVAAICRQLCIKTHHVGVGSSLPSELFDELAKRAGVAARSMPEIGEAIAVKAGLPWGPECDSRGSSSGGGSTVTLDGLIVLREAARKLQL